MPGATVGYSVNVVVVKLVASLIFVSWPVEARKSSMDSLEERRRIVPSGVPVAVRVRVRRDLEELREEAADAVMVKRGVGELGVRMVVGEMRSQGMGGGWEG